jgi:hypothetical protein
MGLTGGRKREKPKKDLDYGTHDARAKRDGHDSAIKDHAAAATIMTLLTWSEERKKKIKI